MKLIEIIRQYIFNRLIKKDKNLNASTLSFRALYFPCIAFSLLVISACSGKSEGPQTPPKIFNQNAPIKAEVLLKKADENNENNNTDWQLAALQALTEEGQYVLADSVIEHLNKKTLKPQQQNNFMLLVANNEYTKNRLELSLAALKKINTEFLSDDAYLHYLKLTLNIYIRHKEHQSAVDTLLTLTPILKQYEEIQQYNDLLFTQLTALSPEILNQFQKTNLTLSREVETESIGTDENSLSERLAAIEAEMNANTTPSQLTDEEIFIQGWYALASLYQRYQLRTNQLLRSLDTWRSNYPRHPALENMPTPLRNISETSPYRPSKIAVLLPLSGRFQKQAQALQYGISDAFYNQIALHKRLRVEEETLKNNIARLSENNFSNITDINAAEVKSDFDFPAPSLLFFDTNELSMVEIAKQLQEQNINFVIGPLLKPNLEKFLPLVENIPVLMLNALPTDKKITSNGELALQGSSLHYSFALSPEGEAEQAAELIFQNKHKKPLILAPRSNFGQRVANAFDTRWKELNSEHQEKSENTVETYPAETHYFTSKPDLARFIDSTLQTNKSKERISQIKTIIDKPVKSEVRSRRDVDAIYLVSDRSELILLKPFISVSISPFAKNIPLYASSRSHDIDLTNQQNKELSNLIFSDITFLMDDEIQINHEVQKIWPKQRFNTLRLFALGYDSFNLIEQLKQLQIIDGHYFQGLTGELTLDKSNTLNSKLQWAKYQKGSLVEVTPPTSSQ